MTTENRADRKTREGIVISDKMDKTITVEVSNRVKHGMYSKVLSRSTKLKAHDETNSAGSWRSRPHYGDSTNFSIKALASSFNYRES